MSVLWVIYWAIVRPCLLAVVEDDLDCLRATVDWAIIEGKDGSDSEAAYALDSALSEKHPLNHISFSQLLFSSYVNRHEMKAFREKQRRIFANSPEWIREARFRHGWIAVRATLLNSPAWWLFIPLMLFATHLSIKAFNWWNDVQNNAADSGRSKIQVQKGRESFA